MQNKPKVVYKYKNIAAALAVLLLILVAISTHVGKSPNKKPSKPKSDSSSAVESQVGSEAETLRLTKNYKYEEFKNISSLGTGKLVIVDENHPFTGTPSNTEGIYLFLFDGAKNQIMYASTTLMEAEAETLTQFNKMAVDFVGQTDLRTLMVSGLIPDASEDGAKYNEASIGTCIDLMLYDSYAGSFSDFKAEGDYAWIAQHCADYGFVLRGQNRLRFVGKGLAGYLRSSGMDLDSFMINVKSYSFESPLMYTSDEFEQYAIYYVEANDGANTSVPVPLNSDDSEFSYEISGNNDDGFIVMVDLTGNESFDEYYNSEAALETDTIID